MFFVQIAMWNPSLNIDKNMTRHSPLDVFLYKCCVVFVHSGHDISVIAYSADMLVYLIHDIEK